MRRTSNEHKCCPCCLFCSSVGGPLFQYHIQGGAVRKGIPETSKMLSSEPRFGRTEGSMVIMSSYNNGWPMLKEANRGIALMAQAAEEISPSLFFFEKTAWSKFKLWTILSCGAAAIIFDT